MENARFVMGKAESVFLVGVECPLRRWRVRGCLINGRDLLVLCESRECVVVEVRYVAG